jgi:hypothetical protein
VVALMKLFATLDRGQPDGPFTWLAVLIVAVCPLFWFTAARPLSDMTGLAASIAIQSLLVAATSVGGVAAAAFLAAFAAGIRSQVVWLTLPLLVLALFRLPAAVRLRGAVSAVAAYAVGALAWAIPLVIATGGPAAYLKVFYGQGVEDLTGVAMLATTPTVRQAVLAFEYHVIGPWGEWPLAAAALVLGVGGLVAMALRDRRTLLTLLVAFGPYLVFDLLFQETITTRYALPLVVPVAWLIVYALGAMPRPAIVVVVAGAAVASLAIMLPASADYAREGSPTFQAVAAVKTGERPAVIGMHAVARRAAEWLAPSLPMRVLKAPHGREWLTLVEQWRSQPESVVWFVADPRRTDLALFDSRTPRTRDAYRWKFAEPPFVGGARPGPADLYRFDPPGWMLERGWAITPEVAGITAKDGWGPHVRPSIAWIKARGDETLLMLGGRNLGAAGGPVSRITVALGGRAIHEFEAAPGFFFQLVPIPAGTFAGAGYLPLDVTAHAADLSTASVPVGLEQFDLQGAGTPMTGVESGWQEPEYNPLTYASWRWTTERATLWVRPVGRDVTLTLSGESPLKYYDAAPNVTVTVGGTSVARFSPSADFTQEIVLPAAALAAAEGRVIIESDKWFVPGERDGSADKRHLALRIYSFAVR